MTELALLVAGGTFGFAALIEKRVGHFLLLGAVVAIGVAAIHGFF